MDEQVKQIYDLWMLLNRQINRLDLLEIRELYWKHAAIESNDRSIDFEPKSIIKDVRGQLSKLRRLDILGDEDFRHRVNDFKGLYLNRTSVFSPMIAAIAGEQLALIYELILSEKTDVSLAKSAFDAADMCMLHKYTGPARGAAERKIKETLIDGFNPTDIPHKVLMGKNLIRVFWAIITLENINHVNDFLIDEINA